jgi:hypothetical protein
MMKTMVIEPVRAFSVAERLPEGLYNISEPYCIGTMLSYTFKEVASWIASSHNAPAKRGA